MDAVHAGDRTPATAPRVALATAGAAIGLDEDTPKLVDALARRGVEARPCIWDDDAVDWVAWDLVVLRSTWDYPRRRDAFVRWAAHVSSVTSLRNTADVVAWNSDKRYLLELADRDVPIVPSAVYRPREIVELPVDGRFVVKPAVSAGAQDTVRYDHTAHRDALAHARRLQGQGRDVLVQPYVELVDHLGETALVFIGGTYSHAVRKGPILGGASHTVGGLFAAEDITQRIPTACERATAEATVDALPFDRADLLYARIDLLPGSDGTPLVLEVELVEPSLFLRFCAGASDRLAGAIAAHLSGVRGRAGVPGEPPPRRPGPLPAGEAVSGRTAWVGSATPDDEGHTMSDERSLSDDDIESVGGEGGAAGGVPARDADSSDGDAVDAVDGDAADADAADVGGADADAADADAADVGGADADAADADAADVGGADADAHDA